MDPFTLYLVLEFVSALLFSLIFTVSQLYYVSTVELNPLQLVLVGTILEAAVLLFEIPTGVLADLKSRRLSVIVGYAVMGAGFLVEGTFPYFATVALAQVLWGLGYTFTSGATQAWVADELGEARAGQAFLRGAQAAPAGALVAIPLSVALGELSLRLPIVLAGLLMIGLSLFLALTMAEKGFTPRPWQNRSTWRTMLRTAHDAGHLVRRQPILLALLGTSLFYGLYSEGFDRLWTPHLLQNDQAPWHPGGEPVAWFGLIRGVMLLTSLATTEWLRRRVDVRHPLPLARALLVNAALIVLSLAGFALARDFWLAVTLFWSIGALRNVAAPLHTTWFNLNIDDPQVRATLFSASGQADALGQIAGGPGVGALGNRSLRAALLTSALLLSPVLPLYGLIVRNMRAADRGRETDGPSGSEIL